MRQTAGSLSPSSIKLCGLACHPSRASDGTNSAGVPSRLQPQSRVWCLGYAIKPL